MNNNTCLFSALKKYGKHVSKKVLGDEKCSQEHTHHIQNSRFSRNSGKMHRRGKTKCSAIEQLTTFVGSVDQSVYVRMRQVIKE